MPINETNRLCNVDNLHIWCPVNPVVYTYFSNDFWHFILPAFHYFSSHSWSFFFPYFKAAKKCKSLPYLSLLWSSALVKFYFYFVFAMYLDFGTFLFIPKRRLMELKFVNVSGKNLSGQSNLFFYPWICMNLVLHCISMIFRITYAIHFPPTSAVFFIDHMPSYM
jgi:hypothetical protein